MSENKFAPGDRIFALTISKRKQTIPAGTKGSVVQLHPQFPGLVWVKTDAPVKAPIGNKKGTKIVNWKESQDFFVMENEIKKI